MGTRRIRVAAVGVLAGVLYLLVGAGRLLERQLPDDEAARSRAWLRTRDLAPGDDVLVELYANAGARTTIYEVEADIAGSKQRVGGERAWGGPSTGGIRRRRHEELGETRRLVFQVPPDAPIGRVPLRLRLTLDVLDRHVIENFIPSTHELILEVREPGDRTLRRVLDIALAVGVSLVAGLLAYLFARVPTRTRELSAPVKVDDGQLVPVVVFLAFLLVSIPLGQLAVIRPVMRTTTFHGWWFPYALMFAWCVPFSVGVWRGWLVQRERVRWRRVRVRSVVGTAPQGGYRESGAALPPSLSRTSEPLAVSDLPELLRAAGFEVVARTGCLEILDSRGPLARLRTRGTHVVPDELSVETFDRRDLGTLVDALAVMFGPLEYVQPTGGPRIVDPSV